MYYPVVWLRERSRIFPQLPFLHALTFVRSMGGGPRTLPGGLNKWQWKRLHEKKAREKEKRLLHQEKLLYEARIRTQIRAELAAEGQQSGLNYCSLSPQNHVKALADRFVTEGAEDLWNENDGPIKTPPPRPPSTLKSRFLGEPIDLRKLILDNSQKGICGQLNNWSKPRHYSVFTRNQMCSGFNLLGGGDNLISKQMNCFSNFRCYSVDTRSKIRPLKFNFRRTDSSSSRHGLDSEDSLVERSDGKERWPRFGAGGNGSWDDDDEEEEEKQMKRKGNVKKMMSSAALGRYDTKIKTRVPLKFVKASQHVETMRSEFEKRNFKENVEEKSDDESYFCQKRFDECNVSPLTVKALAAAGYVQMTRVQEATIASCLDGKDALVKAKTGTGKSAAFLLPALETVLSASSSKNVQRVSPVYVLILCPTRELASQIAAETNVLLKYHDGIGVQTLVGGSRFKADQKHLESDPCQIIVATPGRLLDHIENKSGFSVRLMGLKMLVLDEADHLLHLGFRKDMEKIVDCLPRQRQSLLFSATIPKEVHQISQLVLKREHAFIDVVGLGQLETHAKVKQSYIVAPHEEHFHVVHHLLKKHTSQVLDYKVIIFCTTVMMTSLMFSLFRDMKMNVREMHSRKTQLYRMRCSDEFRGSKRLTLITSEVSARGMNYPDVTLVIQVGIPSDREQYVHRLGRTGREGKEGEGVLLLAPWEEYFLYEIKDLPLEKFTLPNFDSDLKAKLEDSMTRIDTSVKEAAYHAWLGYYNSIREIGRDKTTLVELANRFCQSISLQKPPALFRKTVLKMGLKDIPGIRIRK